MNNLLFSGLITGMFMSSICVCIAPIMVFITNKNDSKLGLGLSRFKPTNLIMGFISVLYPFWILLGLFFAFSFELLILFFNEKLWIVEYSYLLFELLVLFFAGIIAYLIKLIFNSIRLNVIFFVIFYLLFGIAFPVMATNS
ncbi:MAG: hypothetical protein MK334_02320 [SAR202 cluster bacterium]|nr:hypothetical protein [SAR202 cluster bacterium]